MLETHSLLHKESAYDQQRVVGVGENKTKTTRATERQLLRYNQTISTGTKNCQEKHGKRAPHGSHLRRSHAENFARAHDARDGELT
jgi:hypothetical protein